MLEIDIFFFINKYSRMYQKNTMHIFIEQLTVVL